MKRDDVGPHPIPIAQFPKMNRPTTQFFREPVKRVTRCGTCSGSIFKGEDRIAVHARLPFQQKFVGGGFRIQEITYHHPACLSDLITEGKAQGCGVCHVEFEEDDFRAAVFTKRHALPGVICAGCYLSPAFRHCEICALLQPRHVMSRVINHASLDWACEDCADGMNVLTTRDHRRAQRVDEQFELRWLRALESIRTSGILA